MDYVETDCTITHEGRTLEAGGAVVTPEYVIAYLPNAHVKNLKERVCNTGMLQDWHGKKLGTFRIVAVWRTPQSYLSSVMCQVEATVDGVVYTGRSAGYGMLYRGRRKARQPKASATPAQAPDSAGLAAYRERLRVQGKSH